MKVLVTGGAGFIGRHVVKYFQRRAQVYVIDDLRSGFKENLDGLQCKLIQGSILDRGLVREAMQGVDFVFHLAAMVSVRESMQKQAQCAEINTGGTLIVLEEAARTNVKKLVFSSSAAVYGDSPTIPKLETSPLEPKSPYAASKLDAENHCNRFAREGRVQTVCLRYFNVFGPYQNPDSLYAAAVPAFIQHAIHNEPITIFGDGKQTRDFVYVQDVVAVNALFATESSSTGIFNVASGQGITINDLAITICRLTNSSSQIRHVPERPGDVRHSVAAVDKIRQSGFTPTYQFEKGLSKTIDFFRNKRRAGGAS